MSSRAEGLRCLGLVRRAAERPQATGQKGDQGCAGHPDRSPRIKTEKHQESTRHERGPQHDESRSEVRPQAARAMAQTRHDRRSPVVDDLDVTAIAAHPTREPDFARRLGGQIDRRRAGR
jgi:superfamily II RNA helicase